MLSTRLDCSSTHLHTLPLVPHSFSSSPLLCCCCVWLIRRRIVVRAVRAVRSVWISCGRTMSWRDASTRRRREFDSSPTAAEQQPCRRSLVPLLHPPIPPLPAPLLRRCRGRTARESPHSTPTTACNIDTDSLNPVRCRSFSTDNDDQIAFEFVSPGFDSARVRPAAEACRPGQSRARPRLLQLTSIVTARQGVHSP